MLNYTPTVLLVTGLIWSLFVIIDELLLIFFLVILCILEQLQFFLCNCSNSSKNLSKNIGASHTIICFYTKKFNDTFSFLSSYLQIPTFAPIKKLHNISWRSCAGLPKLALYSFVRSTVFSRAFTSSSVRSLYIFPANINCLCSSKFIDFSSQS